jgi:hypothetical protein
MVWYRPNESSALCSFVLSVLSVSALSRAHVKKTDDRPFHSRSAPCRHRQGFFYATFAVLLHRSPTVFLGSTKRVFRALLAAIATPFINPFTNIVLSGDRGADTNSLKVGTEVPRWFVALRRTPNRRRDTLS